MDAERAETCLRLMAEAGLRRAWGPEPAAARVYLARVRAAAMALATVGAIPAGLAASITADLASALELRLGGKHAELLPPAQPAHGQAARGQATRGLLLPLAAGPPLSRLRGHGPAERSGETHAVPVGQMLQLRDDYLTADLWLLSMVRTPDRALFTVCARMSTPPPGGYTLPLFTRIHAADHRGNSYRVRPYGRAAAGGAVGWLSIQPRPPAGTPWLEFYLAGDKFCVRVDLAPGPGAAQVAAEPSTPGSLAERLLDATAADLLGSLDSRGQARGYPAGSYPAVSFPAGGDQGPDGALAAYVDDLIAALAAAGAVPPGSPAAGRLAALCQRAGAGSGRRLVAALEAGIVPAGELPAAWTSVLACLGRRHRPPAQQGVAPLAVVLPALDGIRFVLTGLISEPDRTLLSVAALGLPRNDHRDEFTMPWIHWFPWWIRDNAGQWHLAEVDSQRAEGDDFAAVLLRLVPPLPRSVTRLEVIVPGKAVQLRITTPVTWAQPRDGDR